MDNRPSPANGKRDVFWGTLRTCAVCGRCLCYSCHPQGPCGDERATAAAIHSANGEAVAQPVANHT